MRTGDVRPSTLAEQFSEQLVAQFVLTLYVVKVGRLVIPIHFLFLIALQTGFFSQPILYQKLRLSQ